MLWLTTISVPSEADKLCQLHLQKKTPSKNRRQNYAYQLLVVLEGSEPKIWRQLSVPGNMTLSDLDRIIQAAMGWTNSHLHQFNIEGQVYGVPDDEWIEDLPSLPDDEFTLYEVIGSRVKSFS